MYRTCTRRDGRFYHARIFTVRVFSNKTVQTSLSVRASHLRSKNTEIKKILAVYISAAFTSRKKY